jgi:AraC family transcriptional regulator, regulatory protein of adaptative response / DNA-3-methyladenine glycosylase II
VGGAWYLECVNDDAFYAAMCTRDPRWDGVFFVGVSTTGIYCRPICPARTPGRSRCTFYATAALAEAAGFRACFRCRPEIAPGQPTDASTDAVDALVAAATARIAEGALNDGSVEALAAELGVSDRHLRRTMEARLGTSPVALAQSRRLALAKQLLHDTPLSLAQIAFAAGFGSVRRFNAVFASAFGRAPSQLRKQATSERAGLRLRLDYRPPYEWRAILAFLAARAIPGVEHVAGGVYRRVVHVGDATGTIEVAQANDRAALLLSVSPSLVPVLMPLVARVRRLFDLDARPDLIAAALARDPALAASVRARPGLRVPGAIDGFEAAVRALLGQQVSVAAATTLAGRFARAFGREHAGGDEQLTHRFPTAAEVARTSPDAIASKVGLPGARAAAVHGLARAIAGGALAIDGRAHDLAAFVTAATALPGIGPWTAHYLAMRALHLPDAFPAGDLGVRKALDGANERAAEARAEAWRPFRSYAVMHLWTGGDSDADDADDRLTDRPAAPGRGRRRARGAAPAAPRRTVRRGRAHDARARADRAAARRILRGQAARVRAPARPAR